MNNEPIRFFSKIEAYKEFSNFAPYGFTFRGVRWPTVEHFYQAAKFDGEKFADYREHIRTTRSPSNAKNLGESKQLPIREEWEDIKEVIMKAALKMKFTQNPKLLERLVGTGERPLIEANPYDSYWGEGSRKHTKYGTTDENRGLNRMGILLMQVREELGDLHPELKPKEDLGTQSFRTIIAGSRDEKLKVDGEYVVIKAATYQNIVDAVESAPWEVEVVVSGRAPGVDRLGEDYANRNEIEIDPYPAQWEQYGKSAGYKRNAVMAENADALIAVWDGKSRGTANMIEEARNRGLQVHVHQY